MSNKVAVPYINYNCMFSVMTSGCIYGVYIALFLSSRNKTMVYNNVMH